MDDKTDDRLRSLTAQMHAASFITEYLLRHVFLTLPSQIRVQMADKLLQVADDTSALFGVAKGDEAAAEYIADVGVRSREAVRRLVEKALRITEEMEDQANKQDQGGS